MAGVVLGVRLHRRALDRDLAAGIAGWRSPAHAARLEALLTDGAGPLYRDGRAEALAGALTVAGQWLDAGE
jgi:hypothetical protein